MFCEEPIIAAYEGCNDNSDAFFDCFHDVALHTKNGYRIILETEHYFIFLNAAGVSRTDKTCSAAELVGPNEEIISFVHNDLGESPWIEYEATLFVGERLRSVEAKDHFFLLCFDDFDLKLVPHDPDTDVGSLRNNSHWSYHHVYGCERLIQKKCVCGGTGELLLDFVSDYIVRCNQCNRSTTAHMTAIHAIDQWNTGEMPCEMADIVIE